MSSTLTIGEIIALGVGVAGIGAGVYEASQADKLEGQALGLGATTQQKQNYYNYQLEQLMNNPGTFLNNPLFQSSLDQGLQGVQRSMASSGFGGSGNMAGALEQYGQSQASGQLLSQEQLLASLSGAGAASSPASAISAGTGASTAGFAELGAVLQSMGYASGGGGNPSFAAAQAAFQSGTQGAGSAVYQ